MVDVKKLLDEYGRTVQMLDSQWGDIRAIITGGFAPSKECTDNFFQSIELLRKSYSTMQLTAKEIAPGKAECSCSIQTYAELIEQQQREDANRAKYREILERFVSVVAVSDAFEKALNPYQQSAAALLEQAEPLSENDVIGPSLFLSCLEMKTLDSPEGEAFLEEIITLYPAKVYHGIMFKKYYLREDALARQEPSVADTTQVAGKLEEKKTVQETVLSEASEEEQRKKTVEKVVVSTETEPTKSTAKPAALVSAIKPIKSATPAASAFKSDVMRISAARTILPLFTHLGALIEPQILAFGVLMDAFEENDTLAKSIHIALEKLVDKNMLAAYEMGNSRELTYCLTPYCYSCMQKNSIKSNQNLWNISYGKVSLQAAQDMEAELLTHFQICSSGLLLYLMWARDTQTKTTYRRLRRSITWQGNHYTLSVPWKGEFLSCSMRTALCEPLPEGNILLVSDAASVSDMQINEGNVEFSEEMPTNHPEVLPINGDLFCVRGTVLCRWNGNRWVTEKDEENKGVSNALIPKETCVDISKPTVAFEAEVYPELEDTPEDSKKTDDTPEPVDSPDIPKTRKDEPLDQIEEISIVAYDAQENAKRLLRQKPPIRSEELLKLSVKLIAESRIAEAATLAETLAKAPSAAKVAESFYQTFRQSVQIPGAVYHYSSDEINKLQSILPENDPNLRSLQQTMVLSILLWAMVFPSVAYDHNLYNNARMAVSNTEDQTLQNLVTLLSEDLKDISFQNDGLGFSPAIISILVDNGEQERKIAALCCQASALKRTPTSTINITGLETCLKQMVGPTSKIGYALLWIEKNRTEKAGEIQTMLKKELGANFLNSDDILENYIDQCWNSLRKADSHVKVKRLDNDTPARRVCKKALTDRIAVIKNWLDIVQAAQSGDFLQSRDSYARILNKMKALLEQMKENVQSPAQPYEVAGQNILQQTAKKMLSVLSGAPLSEENQFYKPLCLTPELMLEENGENLIVSELYGIPGLEPWNFVLRAIAVAPEEPTEILAQIDNYQAERWYRNYGSEALLCAYIGENCPNRALTIQNARKDAEQSVQVFKSNTRLNRAYGKIQEHEMETAFSALDLAQKLYFQSHNYASFKGFLKQLDGVLDREIKARAAHYEKQVQELEDTFAGTEMLDMIRRALEKRNFNSVDSYINQLQSGVRELPESDRSMEQKTNFLLQFQDCEEGYFGECQNQRHRSQNPARWGEQALNTMTPQYRHWTSPNEKKKGCNWLSSWIMRKDDSNNGAKVQNLLTGLGFRVKTTPIRDNSFPRTAMYEVFLVSAEKTSPRLKDYAHPIYKFGTDLSDPMYVVCLYGCKGASTLINVMTGELQLSGSTIVLMDGSLTRADRHLVAAKFKADTSGQSPFLLIDRVLLLYLASLDEGDRQKAMLHCTLPYTFEVLYGSGSGAVPEEMFIGRVSEMNDLRNEQGSNLVYGGRQLGKTALLNRASKTIHNPKNLEYSFCVDVKDEGSAVLLEKVNRNLRKLELLKEPCSSLESLCETLQSAYESGKLHRLQIFVDEVDELFNEFSKNDFKALRPFIVLRDDTSHHVKFVFAGTHNVAATDKADMDNNNLVHMGRPLCIEPLSTGDAIKLIRIPMSYLGFEIGDSQIELILSNTNSYPGLIHMFCNALIQSVCRDYELYYSTGQTKENPPYHISDEQMRAVFKEKDIRKEIGTRVMATIKLNRKYRVISCLLAHMVYEDQESEHNRLYGYNVRELLDYNRRELQISLLDEMADKDLEALLDEMARMGILWKNPHTQQFRFRQQDFMNYIGTSDQVIELLLSEDTEGGI